MGVIGINMVLTIVELIIVDTTALFALQIVNYFFVVFYVAEVNVKVLYMHFQPNEPCYISVITICTKEFLNPILCNTIKVNQRGAESL